MLNVVNTDEALRIILENTPKCAAPECIPLEEALGRIAFEDVISPEDLPAFARSTVDGYAVAAEDTYGCSESIPAMLICDGEIKMGETPANPLPKGHCVRISTGGNLPAGADAVSMIEYTDDIGDELRYIYKPVSCLENVNNKGDDAGKGSVVLKKGTVIEARHTAILAALGISTIKVSKKITAGIISTGDELVEYSSKPEGAQIRNINSIMLAGQLRELGVVPVIYPIVKDELALLTEALKKALSECDVALVSGGSSVGEKDNTFNALSDLGEVLFHGISIKPGKPTIFAMASAEPGSEASGHPQTDAEPGSEASGHPIAGAKPVFGLPGHPQAAFFIFKLFAAPALYKMMDTEDPTVCREYLLSNNIPSNHGREEIIPVVISGEYAVPLHSKSGAVSVLSKADGYIRVARDAEGLKKDSRVSVSML